MKHHRSIRGSLALALVGCLFAQLASADPLPNAWQMMDNSSDPGTTLNYSTNLTASQQQAATNSGFHFIIHARFSTDFGGAKTMVMAYGLGPGRFLIWWELNANGDLTAELEGGPTYTLTANGTGNALYHTHEIIYTNGAATYKVDGVVKTNGWLGSSTDFSAGQVYWGAGSSSGQGEMNFHMVTFEVNGIGTVAAYDAGTAGSPPVAPDPMTLGWTVNPSVPSPGTFARPVAADAIGALPNAWQITDNSGTGGLLSYTTNLTASQRIAATNITGGFRYTVNARFVTNFADTKSLAMAYGLGDRRFLVWWDLNGSNDLTADLDGQGMFTLTTNGTGTALYHTHEIIYNPTNKLASYVVDGQVFKTNWTASASDLTAGQVYWGAGSSAGQGQVNFHSVQFQINGLGPVASYDAGMIGDPVVATNPVTQGWTSTPSAPLASATNAVSPDMSLLPVAVTSAADQFAPSGAQLNGTADPSGSPTMAWFEWGASVVYRNSTSPQSMGAGLTALSFSNAISGLLIGTNYHFRAVVSNAFGVVAGVDQDFNLNIQSPIVTTLAAEQFTSSSARLNGRVNPNGSPTMAWFEWGTNTSYGNVTLPQEAGQGFTTTYLNTMLFGLTGTDYHYRFVASNAFGSARGADQSFSLRFFQTSIPGLPGVALSSVAWGDFDNDGRLDFLLTGSGISQLRRNTGSGFTNVPIPSLRGVSDGSVAWGDFDNDGWLDFVITGSGISQLWRNRGNGFTNVTASVAPGLPGVNNSSVAWGDYDNDGRLDFLLTGSGISQLWRNTGNGFTNVPIPSLPGISGGSVAWGDYDNDGWLDFLLTGSGISQLWRNTGNRFTNVTASVAPGLPGVDNSSVAWGDYDNDGRLDFLLTGGTGNANVAQLWRNTGSGFSNVTASVAPGLPGIRNSSVAWGDYDNDGRLDFLFTGTTNMINVDGISQLWRNTGNGFVKVTIPGLPEVDHCSVAWGDYDNDGRLDFLFTGHDTATPFSQLWRNNVPVSNASPAAPVGLSATVIGTTVSLNWSAPLDDRTPAAGLNYNVRIGSVPGAADVLAPMALTNGLRLLPALGNTRTMSDALASLAPGRTYYWSVQALDTSFAGSPFAAEQQFTSPPQLINPVRFSSGLFEFYFTNQSGLRFDVLVATNAALPSANWMNLGPALPLGDGLYRFTDSGAIGQAQRYYLLRSQ